MTPAFPPLAGVVVLYRPDAGVVANIRSYLDALGLLVVVDNSPEPSPAILEMTRAAQNVTYHGGGVNRGIAAALNIGAGEAMARGYEWLLTMDQDSRFEPGSLSVLMAAAARETRPGIVSPRHVLAGGDEESAGGDVQDARYVMTSGNLLSLAAYRQAGPFLEKLFIDYVDCEYCLRLRRHGYTVRVAGGSELRHALGSAAPRRLLGLRFVPTHHDPVRRYYMTRNRLHVLKNYPGFAPAEAWAWFKELAKLILFEGDKLRKLNYMARGARDFFQGRYGPFRG